MRKIFVVLAVVVILSAAFIGQAGAVGTYSEGYRMGLLSDFKISFVMRNGEGQLQLGKESSPLTADYKTSDGVVVPKSTTPWHFSTTSKMAKIVEPYLGKYVWVKYQQHRINASTRETDYEITEIGEVTRELPSPVSYEVGKSWSLKSGGNSKAGRIVKASIKGTLIGTWEIMIQVGEAGNQFKMLSVSDEAVYNGAVNYLKSGKMAIINYVDQGMLKVNFNDTGNVVWKIGPVKDL